MMASPTLVLFLATVTVTLGHMGQYDDDLPSDVLPSYDEDMSGVVSDRAKGTT